MPKSLKLKLDIRDAADYRIPIKVRRKGVVAGTDAVYSIVPEELGGFTGSIDLSISGLPTGATGALSSGTIDYDETATAIIGTTGVTGGSYSFLINSVSAESGDYDWLTVDNADRLIDWTYAGIPGGIPTRNTINDTLGSTATAADINTAITAANGTGEVVYLEAGTYSLSSQIAFGANKSVTLRGAGAGATILNFTATAAVQFGNSVLYGATRYNINGNIAKGSVSFVMADTPPPAATVGGLVIIDEIADYDVMWHRDTYDSRVHRQVCRITDITDNTITVAQPIHYAFASGRIPQARFRNYAGLNSLCGVENLTISGATDLGMYFYESDRCWAKDIEVSGFAGGTGMVRATRSLQTEIRRCYIHDCASFPNNNDGYGIYLYEDSCNSLDINNIGTNTATPHLGSASSGNVIAYNYTYRINRTNTNWVGYGGNCNHMGHPVMNLYEGNLTSMWENDGYHGSASHQTLFRNRLDGLAPHPDDSDHTVYRWIINLARASYYHNIIGNIIGSSSYNPNAYEMTGAQNNTYSCVYKFEYPNDGNTSYTPATTWTNWTASFPDARVGTTVLRHGNYDYYGDAVVWDGGIESHAIPNSLYYASKPAWFGSAVWPPVGPDIDEYVNDIPAKHRWDNYVISGNLSDLFADEG